MAKTENKTTPTKVSAAEFLATITPEQKRKDCETLCALMEKVTAEKPVMWGKTIVGFGQYHYRYESGREGDSMSVGFSPRAKDITVYINTGFEPYTGQLAKLGPHTHTVSCLHIKSLENIDLKVLSSIIQDSVKRIKTQYPA